MKTPLLLALGTTTLLSSCVAPTGDPRQGGIFWSESMAQDRLAQRQGTLNAINNDTAYQESRGRQLRSQYNNMR
jgi:hypothetical protein